MTQTEALELALEVLEGIERYGLDTLSGRVDGPDDRKWQRAGVREMTKRAHEFRRYVMGLPGFAKQPAVQQEPVTCNHKWFRTGAMEIGQCRCIECGAWNTTTAQRTWVGLTPQDYTDIFKVARTGENAIQLAEKILRENNV